MTKGMTEDLRHICINIDVKSHGRTLTVSIFNIYMNIKEVKEQWKNTNKKLSHIYMM